MQPAGRVHDDDVAPARLGRLDRVERDRRRVAAARGADEVRAGPLRPDLELLVGRGAEGVGGGDEHGVAVLAEALAASLPIVVVLPVPLTPTTRITRGRAPTSSRAGLAEQRLRSPPASAGASSVASPRASSRWTSSAVAGTPTSAAISASSSRSQDAESPGSKAATEISSVSARRLLPSESRSREKKPGGPRSERSGAARLVAEQLRPATGHAAA